MRVVYFGTAEFAVPALRAISPHVALVVSQPDRPSGRGLKLQASPVKRAAVELGLTVETPERARAKEFLERIRQLDADCLVVAAYGQILSQALLDSARRGGINLHGSILPFYRGAAPIQRAILEGEEVTGCTLMQMDKGMDSGDVIEIVRTPIGPDETYGELQSRLSLLAADQIHRWLPRIVAGDYPRTPQDHERMTLAPKIAKEEAEIRFERPALQEYCRYRAFQPQPGPFLRTDSGNVRALEARLGVGSGEPGEVLARKPHLEVACAEGSLILLRLQPEGKREVSGSDFANGARLKVGDRWNQP